MATTKKSQKLVNKAALDLAVSVYAATANVSEDDIRVYRNTLLWRAKNGLEEHLITTHLKT